MFTESAFRGTNVLKWLLFIQMEVQLIGLWEIYDMSFVESFYVHMR